MEATLASLARRHQARRCACDVLLDPFAGVGGNAIQFARTCRRVLASDSSLPRLRLARHNAGVYGLEDGIEFRCMDFSAAVASLEVTVSFSYFCCLSGVSGTAVLVVLIVLEWLQRGLVEA